MADKTVTVRLEAVTNGYQANIGAAAVSTKALETQVKSTTAAVQQASPATGAWGNDLNKIGGILNRTVLPAATAAAFAIRAFQNGQDALRTETGATGAQLDGLSQSMVNVGSVAPTSLGKIGEVMGILSVRTGQTGPGLERLTKQLVDLDRMGNKLSTDTATRLFGDWTVSTDEQSAALDQLFRISQVTGTSVEKISASMVKFGAPLREAGFSFGEAAAMAAKFGKEGVNADLVMSGIRISMGRFAAAGREPKQALAETIDEIQRLGDSQAGLDLATQTFGRRAGVDMAKAITEGRLSLKDIQIQLGQNKDTIDDAANATLHFGDQLAILRNKAAGVIGPLGDAGMAVAVIGMSAGPTMTAIGGVTTRLGGMGAAATAALGPALAMTATVVALAAAYELWASKMEESGAQAKEVVNGQDAKFMAGSFEENQQRIQKINDQIAELQHTKDDSSAPWDADMRAGLEQLQTELTKTADAGGKLQGQALAIADASGISRDAALKWVQGEALRGNTFETGKAAQEAYTKSIKDQKQATDESNQTTREMTQSVFGVIDAQRSFQKSLDGIVSAQRAAAKAQEAIVDAQRAYRKALEGVSDAEHARGESLRKLDEATKTVAEAEAALAAERAGPSRDELLGIADAEQSVAEARQKVAEAAAALRKAQHEGSGQDLAKAQLELKAAQLAQQHADAGADKAKAAPGEHEAKLAEDLQKAQLGLASAQRDVAKAGEAVTDAQVAAGKALEAVGDAGIAASDAAKAVTDAQYGAVTAAFSLDTKIDEQSRLFETNAGLMDGVHQKLLDLAATYPQVAAAMQPLIDKEMALQAVQSADPNAKGGAGVNRYVESPQQIAKDVAGVTKGSDDEAVAYLIALARGRTGRMEIGSYAEALTALGVPGRAAGGPVAAGQLYRFGEGDRSEVLNMGGRSYLLPGENGSIDPYGSSPFGSGNSRFSIAATRYATRTPPHIEMAAAQHIDQSRHVTFSPTYSPNDFTRSDFERARRRDDAKLSALAGG